MKKAKRIAITIGIAWLLTLGIHVGTLPGGVPSIGTKDGYYWDDFIDGKLPHYMLGFMDVSQYDTGIPFLFTFSGGAMPASVDLALNADSSFKGKSFVIHKATLVYDDGHRYDIVHETRPRSGIFYELEREGKKYCRAKVAVPGCIWKKQDYTVEVHGMIENGEKDIEIREDVRVLYSENSFVHPGWFYFLYRSV
ncbi:hypothetical protein DDZ13_12985 [Coraliomargarita sinensis]|uniref:Uncharacterized protein n=1 Tax=Coraliomargarita sinensis TaxID=2174842 RepID=A0A317ZJ25_9BACT|nr:hypothetical protein [Coraliomargarita sinensis]PXA03331.1 hypothetical protein DDZ13_12985 [Coraliomargarita sinensis]